MYIPSHPERIARYLFSRECEGFHRFRSELARHSSQMKAFAEPRVIADPLGIRTKLLGTINTFVEGARVPSAKQLLDQVGECCAVIGPRAPQNHCNHNESRKHRCGTCLLLKYL